MEKNRKENIEKLIKARISPNKKSLKNKESNDLLDVINHLCELEAHTQAASGLGINIFELEEKWVYVVTQLLNKMYGEKATSVIMWWVFESISIDGEIIPITIYDEDDSCKEYTIKTPSQLIKILKKHKLI